MQHSMHRGIIHALLALAAIGVIPLSVRAGDPELKWSLAVESNLYAPPLVADVNPAPGLETIISDSEVRRLRCIDARGNELWSFDGGWTRRLTSAAALSFNARPGKATLIVGNPDGVLWCIDGETGTRLWQNNVGPLEWGGAVWADVNGDGRDEVVAGSESQGVRALGPDGNLLWTYVGEKGEKPPLIRCPIAAADIDGDGKQEIFAAGRFGPFCLGGDGALRWRTLTGDDFISTVVIADANRDGTPELYGCSKNEHAAWCFDARTGAIVWKVIMAAGADSYPSSSIAVGDIDQDGVEEILVADSQGHLYCITPDGEIRWTFSTEKRVHAAPSLGDVDGDGAIEILLASGDHYLYCLDAEGALRWRYKTELRLIHPATIADVDNDGTTEILVCGSDKTLRCLTLGGRYAAERIPWPSRRFDAAQSGSCFGKRPREPPLVTETTPLFAWGGFEQGTDAGNKEDYPPNSDLYESKKKHPRGWHIEGDARAACELDTETKLHGASSARITVSSPRAVLTTDLIETETALKTVNASVAAKGSAAVSAVVRWRGSRGLLREDALAGGSAPDSNGWISFTLKDARPPHGARWLQLALVTSTGTAWWDEAILTGVFVRPPSVRALVNQAGYDAGMPKRFTVQSNFVAANATFELVRENGESAFKTSLHHEGRIWGAFDNDWGFEYWRGDFTAFEVSGTYRIRVTLDALADISWPFEIAPDLLWEKTIRPAYRFFYYQRCGADVPGFHKACHLDDAASPDGKRQLELWGGWHDAGDYNTYDNVPYVLGLITAYGVQQQAFDRQDMDGNGRSDFLDEILWGGEHTRRMIAPDGSAYGAITSGYGYWGPPEQETDNKPGTGDERRIRGNETGNDSSQHAAAMARIACCVADKTPWIEAAERALNRALANNQRGPLQFSAALDLYAATQNEKYAALAKELFPGPNIDVIESVRRYDALFHEDHGAALREKLVAKVEEMLPLAQNPFGIFTLGPKEKPNFFGTSRDQNGWHVGTNSHVLQAANWALLAYQYNPERRYLEFAYDQFNWILGNNPYDISLMEGVGSAFPPTYHHRYTFSGVPRGAVPGSVVNGITWRDVGDDRPYFDMSGNDIPAYESNEVWLPHNTAFITALANLRAAQPK